VILGYDLSTSGSCWIFVVNRSVKNTIRRCTQSPDEVPRSTAVDFVPGRIRPAVSAIQMVGNKITPDEILHYRTFINQNSPLSIIRARTMV